MNSFLKENWFKIIIAAAVLIVAVSVGYYFVNKASNSSQVSSATDILAEQQKCAAQSEIAKKDYLLNNDGATESNLFSQNHYDQKLHKCIVELSYMSCGPHCASSIAFEDAYEESLIAYSDVQLDDTTNSDYEDCTKDVVHCQSITEDQFNQLSQEYLSE